MVFLLSRARTWIGADAEDRAQERRDVEAARDGDARAFRRIVEQHHRPLYRLAFRLTGSRTDAQDLVQEGLAKAYVHLDRFDPHYRLSTWLHRIVLNTCRDYLKSAKRREQPAGADPTSELRDETAVRPDEVVAQREMAARVRGALAALKPTYREILVLKDMQGLTYGEISDITGTPVTALKIRALRARAKMRIVLEAT